MQEDRRDAAEADEDGGGGENEVTRGQVPRLLNPEPQPMLGLRVRDRKGLDAY